MYPMSESHIHAQHRNSEMMRAAEFERMLRELRAIEQHAAPERSSPARTRMLPLLRLLRLA